MDAGDGLLFVTGMSSAGVRLQADSNFIHLLEPSS